MTLKIFTVYDSKVEAYLQPFFMRSRGEALRSWQEVVNDPKSQFFKYPSDFTLFEIGEYDEKKGHITMHKVHASLGAAVEFKRDDAVPSFAQNNKPLAIENTLQQ